MINRCSRRHPGAADRERAGYQKDSKHSRFSFVIARPRVSRGPIHDNTLHLPRGAFKSPLGSTWFWAARPRRTAAPAYARGTVREATRRLLSIFRSDRGDGLRARPTEPSIDKR